MSKLYILSIAIILLSACSSRKVDVTSLSERALSLLELQSCEFVYHDILFQGRTDKFLGFITSGDTRLLFSVNLVVKAGVILNKKLEIHVIENSSLGGEPSVQILLPEAQIIGVDAAEDSIHQYFIYEYGLLSEKRIQWLDVQDEVNRAKDRARVDAIQRGILTNAWDNSARVLKNCMRLAGFKNISIDHLPSMQSEKS